MKYRILIVEDNIMLAGQTEKKGWKNPVMKQR